MFFSITHKAKDNFSKSYQLGSFDIYTDEGWHTASVNDQQVLYKGYADIGTMETMLPTIVHQQEPELRGNFCAIVFDPATNTLQIKTDRYRSFPIYITDNKEITNLLPQAWTAWSDSLITIDQHLRVTEEKFNLVGTINLDSITLDEAVDQIDSILAQRVQGFLQHNTLPIKAFLSGGVDSLLVYSYLQRFTDRYEMVKCQHVDYDRFWLMNSGTIKNHFWGYSQIHHWTEPCILTSGAPGDEYMLRSPTTSDLLLKFNNIRMVDLLNLPTWQGCLHQEYFCMPKNYKIFEKQQLNPDWDREMMWWNLCNIIANDWQHWHLGNTLTWTPLRDLEIFKILLRLPLDIQLTQIMNSDISKVLIDRNSPGLSQLISDQKNAGNALRNLTDFLLN
jgi:hypothetical protein